MTSLYVVMAGTRDFPEFTIPVQGCLIKQDIFPVNYWW